MMSKYTDHHWVHQNSEEAADLIEQQQREIDELSATVERLRDYIERGSPYSTNPSKCERRSILAATPQQNLAKRDAALIQQAMIAAVIQFGEKNTTATAVMMFASEYAERVKREAS